MTDEKGPGTVTAALIVIGEEILSGRTQDENIARLRECAGAGTVIRERAQGLYVLR